MSDLTDSVGGAHLFNGFSYSYVPDRFNNLNSAIYFNDGYLRVPSGVYFDGDFSIVIWINLKSFGQNILTFGNIGKLNCIYIVALTDLNVYRTYQGTSSTSIRIISPNKLQLSTWNHIAFILKDTIGYVYVNGVQVGSDPLLSPLNVVRNSNYIGRNPDYTFGQTITAIYDEVKIFKGALTSNQILYEYKSSYSGKYSFPLL